MSLKRHLTHLYAALHPGKRREQTQWLERDGIAFLREIGIKAGDTVIDFGCGPGNYSIPAALLVGDNGLVVAIDVCARPLRRLRHMAAAKQIHNIRAAQTLTNAASLLQTRACNAVLLYDVLHFMDQEQRKHLYQSLHAVLSDNGMLSVHPKHMQGDAPSRHFQEMTTEALTREVEAAGFQICVCKETALWHDFSKITGTVLTFQKCGGPSPSQQAAVEKS